MTAGLTDVHLIINFYIKAYQSKYNEKPIVNRNKVKYLISDMLRDLSMEETKSLVSFYLETELNPNIVDFCYTYDEVIEQKHSEENHKTESKVLLSETAKSVQKFRERFNK